MSAALALEKLFKYLSKKGEDTMLVLHIDPADVMLRNVRFVKSSKGEDEKGNKLVEITFRVAVPATDERTSAKVLKKVEAQEQAAVERARHEDSEW